MARCVLAVNMDESTLRKGSFIQRAQRSSFGDSPALGSRFQIVAGNLIQEAVGYRYFAAYHSTLFLKEIHPLRVAAARPFCPV
jgi:hypothetical protein